MQDGIRDAEVERTEGGDITRVRVVFGPHHFVEVIAVEGGRTEFVLGATHHGFLADASEPGGQLERIIYEVREAHPDLTVD